MDVFKMTTLGIVVSLFIAAHTCAGGTQAGAAIDFHHVPTADSSVVLLSMDVEEPEAVEAEAPSVAPFGTQDTWRFNIMAAGGFALDEDRESTFVLAGVSFSYFLIDNFSLEFEFNVMGFDQPGTDAIGGNFNLLLRWHIIARETWSIYVDAGAGILGTSAKVPPGALALNFTPQAGIGVSFEVAENTRMFIGARLHHVSNANLADYNIGLDNAMAYVGLSFPF